MTVSGRATAAALAATVAVIDRVVFKLTRSRRTATVIPPRPAPAHRWWPPERAVAHGSPVEDERQGVAAEIEPDDRTMAFALLIGPLAFGRIGTLTEFDYQAVGIAAGDGFLKCFAKDPEITRASSESAGA
jgi:hypothetical protein